MRGFGLALALALFPALACAQDAAPLAQWVQLAPGGGSEARIVTSAATCPSIVVDGKAIPTVQRAPANSDFPAQICAATIPAGSHSASLNSVALPLFHKSPQRIMVFGDTGCRIKGTTIQNCNDPKEWPFAEIAAQAAKLKPDLVIHVGDYLYRESPCPAGDKRCDGTPWGDNWPAWAADFFTPAAPLLAASPWVILRGNHEDCERSGPGWLRLLGPLLFNPVASCVSHVPLYTVPLGDVDLAVMDNADAPDATVDADLRTEYEADFAQLAKLKMPLWFAMHRPIWGAVTLQQFGMSVTGGGNRTMIAALTDPKALNQVSLMLAGHIHTFEAMTYAGNEPPAIVAGFGGDALDLAPSDLSGVNISGTRVQNGVSLGGFGFLMMVKQNPGWRIDVYTKDGTVQKVCHFAARRLDCDKK